MNEIEQKKTLTEYPSHRDNPFSENLILTDTKTIKRGVGRKSDIIIDGDTGAVTGHTGATVYYDVKRVDNEQFNKIYTKNLTRLFDLNGNDMKVFLYIMAILRPNRELVQINNRECMEYTGIKTTNTIYRCLSALIETKFICRSKISQTYFINPAIFFNGDRITFIEMIERKRVGEDDFQNQSYMELNGNVNDNPSLALTDGIASIKKEISENGPLDIDEIYPAINKTDEDEKDNTQD